MESKRVRVDCQAELCYDRGITKEGGASMGMKDKQLAKEMSSILQTSFMVFNLFIVITMYIIALDVTLISSAIQKCLC